MTITERAAPRPVPEEAPTLLAEAKSIDRVVESLVAAFPTVPEPVVRDCVHGFHTQFATARIRTYVPILVARRARSALSARQSTTSPTAGAGPVVGTGPEVSLRSTSW